MEVAERLGPNPGKGIALNGFQDLLSTTQPSLLNPKTNKNMYISIRLKIFELNMLPSLLTHILTVFMSLIVKHCRNSSTHHMQILAAAIILLLPKFCTTTINLILANAPQP